ncbi:MAG: aminoacyl-tRNA hydrolase [bacterium]|nr:aminoacyl-tRNA hydrolase [bacterium]
MKLIIGLGNKGEKYAKTRHNLGFMIIDRLSKELDANADFKIQNKFRAEIIKTTFDVVDLILAKPTTLMNLSGGAVKKLTDFYKVSPPDVWIISDDLNLDFGKIRTRLGGSSGGHNGLKSVIENIGKDFVRIRVGIKNPKLNQINPESFVLKRFDKEEIPKLPQVTNLAVKLIIDLLKEDFRHQTITY